MIIDAYYKVVIMFKIIPFIFVLIFVSSCSDDSKSASAPLEFRPTKIADISFESGYVKSMTLHGNVYAVTLKDKSDNINIALGKIDSDGSYSEPFILHEENTSQSFGSLLSLSSRYAVASAKSPDNFYFYRLEENTTLTKLQRIHVEDSSSKSNAGGLFIDENSVVVSELRSYFDEETFEESYDHKVVVYTIESNETLSRVQEIRSDRNTTSRSTNFAASIALNNGLLAVSEGCYIDLFYKDETGTFVKSDSILVDDAYGDDNCYFTFTLRKNYLLAHSRRKNKIYIYGLDAHKIVASQTIAFAKRSNNPANKTLLKDKMFLNFKDSLEISKLTDTEEGVVEVEKLQDMNISVSSLVADDKYILASDKSASKHLFVYDAYPLNQIFVYNDFSKEITIDEKELYGLYSIDAGSPAASLEYSLSGVDAEQFEINGTTIYNRAAFDYDNPQDSNGDNVYKINVDIQDADANTKSVALSVKVVNRDYLLEAQKVADDSSDGTKLGKSIAVDGSKVLVGATQSAYLFDTNNKLAQLLKMVPQGESVDGSFGESVALSGDTLLVGAPNEDLNDTNEGALYLFKIDENNTLITQSKLVMQTLEPQILFGKALAMDGAIFAVSAPGYDYAYRGSGKVFIYSYDADMKPTLLQTLLSNEPEELDKFGSAIALSENYLVVGAPNKSADDKAYVGAVYVYKRDGNSFSFATKLSADTVVWRSYFGSSVATSGEYIVTTTANATKELTVFKMSTDDRAEKIALIEGVSGSLSIQGRDIFVVSSDEDKEEILYHYVINADDSVILKESIKNHTNQYISSSDYSLAQGDGFCVSGARSADVGANNSGVVSLYVKEKK